MFAACVLISFLNSEYHVVRTQFQKNTDKGQSLSCVIVTTATVQLYLRNDRWGYEKLIMAKNRYSIEIWLIVLFDIHVVTQKSVHGSIAPAFEVCNCRDASHDCKSLHGVLFF